MDTGAIDGGDWRDLDRLMVRVREAAMAGSTSGDAARQETSGEATGADLDLVRIVDAQGEWNEHARQSLAALVECLRTLREDWSDEHARLREEVRQLSALVTELRKGKAGAATRAKPPSRAPRKRRSITTGGRRRS